MKSRPMIIKLTYWKVEDTYNRWSIVVDPGPNQLLGATVRSSTFRLDQPRPTGFPFIQAGNRQGDHTTMFKEPVWSMYGLPIPVSVVVLDRLACRLKGLFEL